MGDRINERFDGPILKKNMRNGAQLSKVTCLEPKNK